MIKLKHILLNEGRSHELDLESAISVAKKNCKVFINANVTYIYRGMSSIGDFGLSTPASFTRKSRHTENYYTLMLDNFKSWAAYPKRAKSLICSTSKGKASVYGEELYLVIPFDTANIGLCSENDIWDSFPVVEKLNLSPLAALNSALRESWQDLFGVETKYYAVFTSIEDADFSAFSKSMELYDSHKQKIKDMLATDSWDTAHKRRLMAAYLKSKLPMMQFLEKILDPKLNGFSVSPYKNFKNVDDGIEVWTDSPCILVYMDAFATYEPEMFSTDGNKFLKAIGKSIT